MKKTDISLRNDLHVIARKGKHYVLSTGGRIYGTYETEKAALSNAKKWQSKLRCLIILHDAEGKVIRAVPPALSVKTPTDNDRLRKPKRALKPVGLPA